MDASTSDKSEESAPLPADQLSAEQHEILSEIEKAAAKGELTAQPEPEAKRLEDSKYEYYNQNHYTIDPKVGLVYNDSKVISSQRTLVFGIIKRAGSNLFSGKSIMGSPLPIAAYEPYSALERVASLCCYMPAMLAPLADVTDPVERLRKMMAWEVASMHLGIGQQKPFNCSLGETMQAKIGDLEFYAENVPTHPPAIIVSGKDFFMYGNYEIVAHTFPNSAKITTHGDRIIEFSGKVPAKYTVTHPEVHVSGIMLGKREFRYKGNITFEDKTNGLYGQIRVNPFKKGFFSSIFTKQKYRDDHFKGFITKNKELLTIKTNSVFDSKDVISSCEGYWVENISFDGKLYWEIGRNEPTEVTRVDGLLLPSDTSLRPDINALARGDEKEAQRLKDIFEEEQRRDKKLREEAAKKQKAKEKPPKKK